MSRLTAKQKDAYNLGAQCKRAGVKREDLLNRIGMDARSRRPNEVDVSNFALQGWDDQKADPKARIVK